MEKPEDIPCCFWHPDVPSQGTLRQLLKNYPPLFMRYEVGRACAAGGYEDLYKELDDLLPDVAIAEEARDNLPVSKGIHDMAMVRAFLNGDTCIRSTLEKRQPVHHEIFPPPFDIVESWCLTTDGKRLEERPIPSDILSLLYAPLPRHLPSVEKDILLLMAAFTGNIDRYLRLRRPHPVNGDMQCTARGIYHNTFFAKWCYEQLELAMLLKFVHARFIMNDDLTWLNNDRPFSKEDARASFSLSTLS
ncbi:hypothetical protein NW753_000251 [Fusarium oxysporum]|nr:hypothetical protein NW763_008412 [Fusarium oxysporum]KAJ4069371.1 hypothetical protein NW753_000251 [Fusarium oxysporum]KAJ4118298.1 hypothetical protein NW769_003101 [Fusarium oxysporum]